MVSVERKNSMQPQPQYDQRGRSISLQQEQVQQRFKPSKIQAYMRGQPIYNPLGVLPSSGNSDDEVSNFRANSKSTVKGAEGSPGATCRLPMHTGGGGQFSYIEEHSKQVPSNHQDSAADGGSHHAPNAALAVTSPAMPDLDGAEFPPEEENVRVQTRGSKRNLTKPEQSTIKRA